MSDGQLLAAVRAALEARPGATGDALPSAPGVVLHKVMGKMFAILEVRKAQYLILKCDPHLTEILREQYSGVGHRSHLDRRFWICIDLDGDVPEGEIVGLIERSYDLVCAGLTRKQRAELAAMAGQG
jgi:predicted DNA-binding protein (MmcQ/YjbR family)